MLDVLIVDDDADIRTTLAELLGEEGYSVDQLEGISGLAGLLEREQPRLLLLDLTLPGPDLQSVLAKAHQLQLLRNTAVFAMSGLDDTTEIATQLGLDGAVRKPFEIAEILALIERICRPQDGSSVADQTGVHP